MRDDFIPEGRSTCPDCGGYTEPDLLDMGHDADFDRCECESPGELRPEVHKVVDLFDALKRALGGQR